MVARRERRRRAHFDGLYEQPCAMEIDGCRGRDSTKIEVRLPADFDPSPSQPLAKLFDGDDDVFVVPGQLAVSRADDGPGRLERLADELDFDLTALERSDQPDAEHRDPAVALLQLRSRRSTQGPLALVRATLDVIGRAGRPDEEASPRPVYGFLTHQTTQPSDDPEPAPPVPRPTGAAGADTTIVVIDTGLDPAWPWLGSAKVLPSEADPLATLLAPRQDGAGRAYLGWAAGHATFIAGVLQQVAPGAQLRVLRAANTEGYVDEDSLALRLRAVAAAGPDLVVLSCGGYAVKLGSFGTAGTGKPQWLEPLLLRRAVRAVADNAAGTVVVCSAGNSDSIDPCFPAAFAPQFDGVVSVAALEPGGRRYCYSNYGDWVKASALGARLRSTFVGGPEHPGNDPDGHPDDFAPGSFAEWSGTSFAAPVVAGRVAVVLSALRAQFGPTVTARQAWAQLAATSSPARDQGCGAEIAVSGLAHG
jgi:hypothetical protein